MKIFSTAKLWGDKYMVLPYSLLTIEFSGSCPSQMESSLTYCLAPGNLPEHIFSHPLTCSTWNLFPHPGQQPRWIPAVLCLCACSLVGLECHPVLFHHAEWVSIFKSHSMSSVKLVLILPGRVSSDSFCVSTAICIMSTQKRYRVTCTTHTVLCKWADVGSKPDSAIYRCCAPEQVI